MPQQEQFNARFLNFLQTLHKATLGGRVSWTETAEENTFRITFKKGMVHIALVELDEDSDLQVYRAAIFNENNSLLAKLEAPEDIVSPNGTVLRKLYELARGSALRPESTLEGMEQELQQRCQ